MQQSSWAIEPHRESDAKGAESVKIPLREALGGDLASTWVVKPEVHAELQSTRKTVCKLLVANDDNYALAA